MYYCYQYLFFFIYWGLHLFFKALFQQLVFFVWFCFFNSPRVSGVKRTGKSHVFVFTESGQPDVPLERQFLANELQVTEDASSKSV